MKESYPVYSINPFKDIILGLHTFPFLTDIPNNIFVLTLYFSPEKLKLILTPS